MRAEQFEEPTKLQLPCFSICVLGSVSGRVHTAMHACRRLLLVCMKVMAASLHGCYAYLRQTRWCIATMSTCSQTSTRTWQLGSCITNFCLIDSSDAAAHLGLLNGYNNSSGVLISTGSRNPLLHRYHRQPSYCTRPLNRADEAFSSFLGIYLLMSGFILRV